MDLPGRGLQNVFVAPYDQKNQLDGTSTFLRVVHAGNVYDIVKGINADELKHSGYKKVMDYVQCHCARALEDGSLMVECEECQKWFHAECENVKSEKLAKSWNKCHLCVKRGQ